MDCYHVFHDRVCQIVFLRFIIDVEFPVPQPRTKKSWPWRCHGCVLPLFAVIVFAFCNMMSTVVLNFSP
ncbi:hypothetical protein EUGRSUZ_I00391 [Eucalyptus grandis]|uniref:Uncharacterized protein n=2 Tax=Eucalyptus grandis TaxID=71139 RepID=A0ACC3JCP2_EUCGR|nr:hypothetical protein EUGRSUZ_I00391 [Eucalyptus grandis]